MDAITLIGAFSVFGACICMGIGSIGSALGEGRVAASALTAMAQQPDESSRIRSTMFVAIVPYPQHNVCGDCHGGNHSFVCFADCIFGAVCQSVLELCNRTGSIVIF